LAEGSYHEVSNNPLVVEAYMGSHGNDAQWAIWP
jgi:branched-chain amino acid transport system ATP-binding protein